MACTSRISRRRLCLGAAASIGLAGCGSLRRGEPARPCAEVAPFSTAAARRGLPECWHEQVMRRDLPPTRYRIDQRDDRRVLHAVAERSTSGLRCDVDIDPLATPWLDWTWRVDGVAPQATVAADELDDCPARVIVAFDGDRTQWTLREQLFGELVEVVTGHALPFATLMYVWDGRAAPESIFHYPRSSRIRYLVVESGPANAGRWLDYRRHVADDYRRVFGAEPGRVRSVGVMTDTDDLKTRAEAWYGDLGFRG